MTDLQEDINKISHMCLRLQGAAATGEHNPRLATDWTRDDFVNTRRHIDLGIGRLEKLQDKMPRTLWPWWRKLKFAIRPDFEKQEFRKLEYLTVGKRRSLEYKVLRLERDDISKQRERDAREDEFQADMREAIDVLLSRTAKPKSRA